jgi:hypothetical protein
MWDMLRVHASHFYMLTTLLAELEKVVGEMEQNIVREGLDTQAPSVQNIACETIWATVQPYLEQIKEACKRLDLDHALRKVYRIQMDYEDEETYIFHNLQASLKELGERIEDELDGLVFMYVPAERSKYFEKEPPPFGDAVRAKFPEAIADVEDAGGCLGVGCSTAAVYHLMRVVECGIRRLRRRLKLPAHLERKPWGKMFGPMNAAIAALPYTSTKEVNKRDSYSEAMAHLENVKNAWRNPTMHSKRRYTQEEAEAIFGNVRTFMDYLATKVFCR